MNTSSYIETTEQQKFNESMAALAAAGNRFAMGQLWETNRSFIGQRIWMWYSQNQSIAKAHGLTLEDLEQEGFFAVQYAAENYNPEKGNFLTYLNISIQRQINKSIRGEHVRLVATEDGRQMQISANPLNGYTSLDIPMNADDADSDSLVVLQPDPAATADFEAAEADIYTEELHAALEEALNKLSQREAKVIRGFYWKGQRLADLAEAEGVTTSRIGQTKNDALRKLAQNPKIRQWHDDIISVRAWHGTGFGAWYSGGSVEERTVEWIERQLSRKVNCETKKSKGDRDDLSGKNQFSP